jgi:hypothetical protein
MISNSLLVPSITSPAAGLDFTMRRASAQTPCNNSSNTKPASPVLLKSRDAMIFTTKRAGANQRLLSKAPPDCPESRAGWPVWHPRPRPTRIIAHDPEKQKPLPVKRALITAIGCLDGGRRLRSLLLPHGQPPALFFIETELCDGSSFRGAYTGSLGAPDVLRALAQDRDAPGAQLGGGVFPFFHGARILLFVAPNARGNRGLLKNPLILVSPVDVPAICDFNRLICPTRSNALLERKSEFPKLSNRVHGAALLPGAPSPRTMRSATRHDRK